MEKVKITMYLPADVAKKFKVFCAVTERSYGDWVQDWLEAETAETTEFDNIENKVTLNGKQFDHDAVVNLMDDELRDELHCAMAGNCTEQEFVDEYIKRHKEKYGEDFIIN